MLLFALTMGYSWVAGAEDCSSLDAARWLQGDWVARTPKAEIVETWRAVSADTFEGSGQTRSLQSGETVGEESLRLVAMSGKVFFVAKVAHNPLPVPFLMTVCSPDQLVFENADHDFPNRLDYRRVDADTLHVSVSDSGGDGFILHFKRVAAAPQAE